MNLSRRSNSWAKAYLPGENYTNTVIYNERAGVGYLTFKPFINMPYITHGFSTRIGGVSSGHFATMNLSYSRGDEATAVDENYRRMAAALQVDVESMTSTKQTHTTNVIEATYELRGNGIIKKQALEDIDGLVTRDNSLTLVTSYADCVPLYFVDTVNKAIGLSHSGWRGTAGNICQSTVDAMKKLYNSQPKDIVTFIGPSICDSCYEVSSDLLEPFSLNYATEELDKIFVLKDAANEKYYLNLALANVINMQKAGIPSDNIFVTDVCTCCNSDILFSHRASHGLRGGLCGFLKLN